MCFNLEPSNFTFNLEKFRSHFEDLVTKLDTTYFLLVMDMNSTEHGYFIFYKLNNYKNKDKLIISLYYYINKIIFDSNGNQKAEFKGAYLKDNDGIMRYNNLLFLEINKKDK